MSSEFSQSSVGFIGAGRMATALAKGMLKAEFTTPEQVVAADVSPAACERFATETGCRVVADNAEVLAEASLIVLAVKPQLDTFLADRQ